MGGVSGVAMTAIITFVSGALITFIGFELLYLINKKRQKHLDDKYDDKEEWIMSLFAKINVIYLLQLKYYGNNFCREKTKCFVPINKGVLYLWNM